MDTDLTDLTAIRQRAEAGESVDRGSVEFIARGLKAHTDPMWPFVLMGAAGDILLTQADRIEALERALVTARTALEDANKWHGYAPLGREAPGIEAFAAMKERRQQAITEIAGALIDL